MTSRSLAAADEQPTSGFVWIWLPDATEPVIAGRVDQQGESLVFRYGRSYLENEKSIPIYVPELPLGEQEYVPQNGAIHGCLDDAGPDSWGNG